MGEPVRRRHDQPHRFSSGYCAMLDCEVPLMLGRDFGPISGVSSRTHSYDSAPQLCPSFPSKRELKSSSTEPTWVSRVRGYDDGGDASPVWAGVRALSFHMETDHG